MPTIKSFTPANVRSLPDGEYREQVDSGLVLRVQGKTRSYCVAYTRGGKARRILLGHVGEVELGPESDRDLKDRDDARAQARKMHAAITQGRDPFAEQQEAKRLREAEGRKATVKALCEAYLKAGVKRDGVSMGDDAIKEARSILETYVYPTFGSEQPENLERWRVIDHLAVIAKRVPGRARHVLSTWRRACSWAEDTGRLKVNPLLRIAPPAPTVKRDRVLEDSEIRWLWRAMDARHARRESEHQRPSVVAFGLKLSLLSACRMGAIAAMKWSEVREEAPGETWWTVPNERTKNRKGDHRVFVTPQIKAILDIMQPITGTRDHVFAADSKTGGMTTWGSSWSDFLDDARALAREAGDEHAFVERTTAHDLRRTAATRISEMFEDVAHARFIVQRILNHTDSSVSAIYDRSRHDRMKRRVLTAWNQRVDAVLDGKPAGSVIQFPAMAEGGATR